MFSSETFKIILFVIVKHRSSSIQKVEVWFLFHISFIFIFCIIVKVLINIFFSFYTYEKVIKEIVFSFIQ